MPFSLHKIFLLCIITSLFTCGKRTPSPHEISFYHWQSKWNLSIKEQKILQDLKVRKLYVKFFDIKWDKASQKILPVAQIQGDSTSKSEQREIIPCVFIENRVFQHLDSTEVRVFAQVLCQKLLLQSAQFATSAIREIQIDCDWSHSTRSIYFSFLRHLKVLSQKEISSTIRLHQIKYLAKTGVPPVTKGVLMCYNLGSIQDVKENNSIFNLQLLKNYTQQISSYPLHLDIALPLYEWAVVFRNERFTYVMNTSKAVFQPLPLEQVAENRYTCTSSARIGDKALLKGDLVRMESVSDKEIEQTIAWFDERLKNYTIVFYHLEEQNLVSHEGVFRVIPTF